MQPLQDTHKAFIALVRLGIGHNTDRLPDSIDWSAIQEIASEHGLTAIVLDGIQQLPETKRPPQEILLQWIGEVLQGYEYRYEQYKRTIAGMAGFNKSHGLKMMILRVTPVVWIGPSQSIGLAET